MAEKRKFSAIWNHFAEQPDKKAKCNYCKAFISIAGGSHGNLSRHMKTKHPLTPLNMDRQTPVPMDFIEIAEDQPSTSSQAQQNVVLPRQPQTAITQFFRRPPPARKVEVIDRQVLKMVAKGHHALRIVEEPEFKRLIELVSQCPGYSLPTRKTLSHNIMETVYSDILCQVKTQLHSASAICLTTDGWTSKANESYLAVTAHYIADDTVLKSHLIACDKYDGRHTSENLCSFLKDVMKEYNIENKITAVVSDNAANITAAIRLGQWRGVSCFAHSLNLVVQTALKEVNDIVTRVKRVVEYFHKSTQGTRKLKETQKHMELPELKLKQDVVTRWNSTYDMVNRIVLIKDAVISTLSLTRPDLALTPEDWEILKDVIPVLEPFYEVTKEISSEKNVTLSKVLVLCNLLECSIAECCSSKQEVISMISVIKTELTSRFGELERTNLYAESTILDPRFKRIGFKNNNSYENAVRTLKTRISQIRLQNSNETPESVPEEATEGSRKNIWKKFDQNYNKIVKSDNNVAAGIRELDKYLNEEYLDRKQDPLVWWNERKKLYPRVYTYALKRLCIVATSVPCERIFSATGQIINERRTLLKPSKVSSLVFLHHNM